MNEIVVLIILLLLSAVFSGSETALTAVSMLRIEGLVADSRAGAIALLRLKRSSTRMLIALLIGQNVVNIGAAAFATVLSVEWFGELGPGIAVGVLTFVMLVFCEIVPKSLAIRHCERISLAVARPMLAFKWLVTPIVWLLERFTTWIERTPRREPTVTESELMSMVEHGEQEGTIETEEAEMIERVMGFSDLNASDVMTPRNEIFALSADMAVRDALDEVLVQPYSRIPVYGERRDEIRRVCHLRDILEATTANQLDAPLGSIGDEPSFVPETQSIDETFATLRQRQRHLALVVDEHGTLQGLVTLEDLLEELVGEIYDESDRAPQGITQLGDHRIALPGDAELRLVEDFFDLKLAGKPTDTVSLWILNELQRIPRQHERSQIDGLDVLIERASPRRIYRVVMSRAT